MQTPLERRAQLLSKGDFLTSRVYPSPGVPGTPSILHNGLGRYFFARQVMDANQRIQFAYAPDPDRTLELAATRIRRDRFGNPKYDQDNDFPVTRRLAYAAFPDTSPKNQPQRETPEERIEQTMYDHLDSASQAWNV